MLNGGKLEHILELLDVDPELGRQVPLMLTRSGAEWKVINRTEAILALRRMISAIGRDPLQCAPRSGRIRGATSLAAMPASELHIWRASRWKSLVLMSYVRAGGQGGEFVSNALAR